MTLPSWPTELERPLRDGFSQQIGDNRRRQKADQGPPRMRRSTSKAIETIGMSFMATADLRDRFWRFYREEVGSGALPFLVPDWGRDGLVLWDSSGIVLTDEDGTPLLIAATWVCVFGDRLPGDVPVGVEWRIQFDLVVLP